MSITAAFSHLGNEFAAKSSGSPFVQWIGTICESLEECIMRNTSGYNILNLDQCFRRCYYLVHWQPLCSMEPNHLCNSD